MLIALLIRLIAEVFVTRPAGIAPGRWSPHAKWAVRHLEQRHFALPIALGAALSATVPKLDCGPSTCNT